MNKLILQVIKEACPQYGIESDTKFTSSSHVVEAAKKIYKHDAPEWGIKEYAYAMYLNRNNLITDFRQISVGGFAGTVMDVKDIFIPALLSGAHCLVIFHNHPSGNLSPSHADREVTRKIQDAGKTLEISVLDHIILTEDSYYSFADNGDM